MRKSIPILFLIVCALFLSCNADIYKITDDSTIEDTNQDINSLLANKYIELFDSSKLIKESIDAITNKENQNIKITGKPSIADNTIEFSVELIGKAENTASTKESQIDPDITEITGAKGYLDIKLTGLMMENENAYSFLAYTYSITSPDIEKTLVITDDKNENVELYLNEYFGSDIFAIITMDEEKAITGISGEIIACPIIPIENATMLVNWDPVDLDDISNNTETIELKEEIQQERASTEVPYLVEDILSRFREDQFRYALATLNKEVAPIEKAKDLPQTEINEAVKKNEENLHIGIADYLASMSGKGSYISIINGKVGRGWLYPKDPNSISSSGLKLNTLYLETKGTGVEPDSGDAIMDITFADDTRAYFNGGEVKIKAGSRVFLALPDCSFDYKGMGNSGDNMKLSSNTYIVSTTPDELLSNFKDDRNFKMPEKGSIVIEYKGTEHKVDINSISGNADIYIGIDFRVKNKIIPIAFKATLELNEIGESTSYDIVMDGYNVRK